MKIETITKIIRDNTNCLGYCNSSKLIKTIQYSTNHIQMKITVIKTPSCTISTQDIMHNIIIPLIKNKECLYNYTHKEHNNVIYVYSTTLFNLRVVDRICSLLNSQLSELYNFQIITNYDIISSEEYSSL